MVKGRPPRPSLSCVKKARPSDVALIKTDTTNRTGISHRTRRVILGPFVEGPGIISPCPAVANATKEAGSAISLLIGPDGKLKDIKVSGNSGPVRQKEEEIRSALSVCKFLPRTVDGDPAPEGVWMTFRQAYLPRPAESSAPGRR